MHDRRLTYFNYMFLFFFRKKDQFQVSPDIKSFQKIFITQHAIEIEVKYFFYFVIEVRYKKQTIVALFLIQLFIHSFKNYI